LNKTSIELYSNNDNATLSEDNRTLTMSMKVFGVLIHLKV